MSKSSVISVCGGVTMIVTTLIAAYLFHVVVPDLTKPTKEERLAKQAKDLSPYLDHSDNYYNENSNEIGGSNQLMQQSFGRKTPAGTSSSSKVATQMQATTRCKTGEWSKVRGDLIETVVPELEIVIVDQSETEASNQDLHPDQEDYVSKYRTSAGEYRLNVPMGEKLNSFTQMIKSGRFGRVPFAIRVNKKMVEAPMKDLSVEIKLAEADLERVQKLQEWSAKLDEKLRLNTMLRDALRELEYLKSQERKMTTKVEYADVTFRLRENPPQPLPDFIKALPMPILAAFVGCLFFFLLGLVAAFNPKQLF